MTSHHTTKGIRRRLLKRTLYSQVPRGAASSRHGVVGASRAVSRIHRLCQHHSPLRLHMALHHGKHTMPDGRVVGSVLLQACTPSQQSMKTPFSTLQAHQL